MAYGNIKGGETFRNLRAAIGLYSPHGRKCEFRPVAPIRSSIEQSDIAALRYRNPARLIERMMDIKPEDMARYRAIIAKLELTQPHIDESIFILRAIMQSFVDRAFGDDAVQLALNARLNRTFNHAADHANFTKIPKNPALFSSIAGQNPEHPNPNIEP
jgi:hypothetical protein